MIAAQIIIGQKLRVTASTLITMAGRKSVSWPIMVCRETALRRNAMKASAAPIAVPTPSMTAPSAVKKVFTVISSMDRPV